MLLLVFLRKEHQMEISKAEYFYFEWLILDKNISSEQFEKLTEEEHQALRKEYAEFQTKLVP